MRTQEATWTKGNRDGTSVPEPWYTLAKENGMVDPGMGVPSIAAISRKTGISAMTVSRILRRDYGSRGPSPALVKQFAEPFGVDPSEVTKFLGIGELPSEPWQPPEAAGYLSDTDGKLVTQLILRLTREARSKGGAPIEAEEEVVEVAPAKKARATKVARRPAKATAGARRRG